MRNIEYVIGHFDGPLDYRHWLKVGEHYTSADGARRELASAIEGRRPISLGVAFGEPRHSYSLRGDRQVYVFIRFGIGRVSPNIPTMQYMINRTSELIEEWVPGEGFECEVDPKCNSKEDSSG